jgi:hypothetical protein
MPHLNSYRPSSVPDAKDEGDWDDGDREAVAMFEKHAVILIGADPAKVLLDWMAYCVQKPGDKIKWSVLIKGTEGDGKSYFGDVLRAVMGAANVGTVNPKVLNTDFNGYAEGHCACLLEEIRMAGHNRHDVLNALKELHTNDIITIHRKGIDSYQVCNTQNYLGFTNYADALPINDEDRRWYIAFSPFIGYEELIEAGLTPAYFDSLFSSLSNHIGALRAYLLSRDVSEFDAKGRAPDSLAKRAMVAATAHEEDEIVKEIIEEGSVGISKHIVSTSHLSAVISMGHPDIEVPKGRGMATTLSRLGFHKVSKQIKWKGAPCRVWVKRLSVTQDMTKVRELLDDTSEVTDEQLPF